MDFFRRWAGLRCLLLMCPHKATRDGYVCMICDKEERWDDR